MEAAENLMEQTALTDGLDEIGRTIHLWREREIRASQRPGGVGAIRESSECAQRVQEQARKLGSLARFLVLEIHKHIAAA